MYWFQIELSYLFYVLKWFLVMTFIEHKIGPLFPLMVFVSMIHPFSFCWFSLIKTNFKAIDSLTYSSNFPIIERVANSSAATSFQSIFYFIFHSTNTRCAFNEFLFVLKRVQSALTEYADERERARVNFVISSFVSFFLFFFLLVPLAHLFCFLRIIKRAI